MTVLLLSILVLVAAFISADFILNYIYKNATGKKADCAWIDLKDELVRNESFRKKYAVCWLFTVFCLFAFALLIYSI